MEISDCSVSSHDEFPITWVSSVNDIPALKIVNFFSILLNEQYAVYQSTNEFDSATKSLKFKISNNFILSEYYTD